MGDIKQLSGRHALITGAGSGIGKAIARALHQAGARLTLAGRRSEPLQNLTYELGLEHAYAAPHFDVTDPSSLTTVLTGARKQFGPIDILINNVGEAPSAPFYKTDQAFWSKVIAVNLTGAFNVTQAVLPDIKAYGEGGRIINIASTAGLVGYAYVSAYCAAKHGVVGLTRALALELAKTGITVNAVCPGYTDTAIITRSIADIVAKTGRTEDEALTVFTKSNPQGRLVRPEEVADTVLWLASPKASSINGQAIAVAGGEVLTG